MAEDSPTHEAMRRASIGNTDGQPHAGALAVQYRSINALIPYVNNARTHSDEQVAQIAASITEFGWTNPVLVDGDNGIIAGHGRVQAARKLGLTQIPVIELEGLSETQKKAYVLADNRIASNAGWNAELLENELSVLAVDDFDMSKLGFDSWDLDESLFEPDETPEGQGLGIPIIHYDIVFDDEQQQATWYEFMKHLRVKLPTAETNAQRLITYVEGELK